MWPFCRFLNGTPEFGSQVRLCSATSSYVVFVRRFENVHEISTNNPACVEVNPGMNAPCDTLDAVDPAVSLLLLWFAGDLSCFGRSVFFSETGFAPAVLAPFSPTFLVRYGGNRAPGVVNLDTCAVQLHGRARHHLQHCAREP